MSYTIYDLAKDGGVSVATVSRVINNNGSVKEKTKQRILDLIKEKNYTPNAYARGMNNISIKTIGVIIADIVNPFFAEVVRGIENSFQKSGYNIILCSTNSNLIAERNEIDLLIQKQVQGFIIVGSRLSKDDNSDFIIKLSETYPVVLVNSFIKGGYKLFSVLVDEHQASFDAISYFISNNQTDIYLLGDPAWRTTIIKINSFKKCFIEHNLEFNKDNLVNCNHSYLGGKMAVKELLKKNISFPYTLFCSSDTIAIGAMREFLECGIKIPEQVSIMGYSNIEVSALTTPSLSTIDQKLFLLGNRSGNLLMNILSENYPINKKNYSDYELLIRESTSNKK